MLIFTSVVLLVNAFFNVIVWPQFLRRVSRDDRARDEEGNATSFLRVHQVLITLALTIAAVSAVGGVVGLVNAATAGQAG
ncbi:SCO4848 family membrane protein [Pseudoclavibacter caeni]|jgi:hypothetical protein|uniref:Uncharacterized protein n=1 Tax=Pseudoclavibacter caeni TaxID=908846 RepID=A0A7C8FI86_9MICO|nr:hypothetical protein [Pseudoclavibacter caeni]KAB1631758.1 hypothetical protein F8O02_07415 [Pseudoclavibacter caeni]NYJ97394.1 hypothetical protein [Pseudoclavibacter caeni]